MQGTDLRKNHLPSLTGLRFFAASMVVLLHAAQRFDPISGMTHVVGFGYIGVSFFFMLSGFILAWTAREGDSPMQFYWRRFARVWPLHALTTGFAIIVAMVIGLPIIWSALPAVLSLTQAWFPGPDVKYAFNGPSWSLSCEMLFYLLFPWLIKYLAGRRTLLSTALIVALVMVVFAAVCALVFPTDQLGYLLYTMPIYRLGEFILGICLGISIQRGWRPPFTMRQAVMGTAVMFVILTVAVNFALNDVARLPYFVADLWMLPGCASVMAAGAAGDLRGERGIVRSRPVVKLGQWSFALYLVHELVFKLAEPLLDQADLLYAVIGTVLAIVLGLGLAALLYEGFERPVEKRLRALALRNVVVPTGQRSGPNIHRAKRPTPSD